MPTINHPYKASPKEIPRNQLSRMLTDKYLYFLELFTTLQEARFCFMHVSTTHRGFAWAKIWRHLCVHLSKLSHSYQNWLRDGHWSRLPGVHLSLTIKNTSAELATESKNNSCNNQELQPRQPDYTLKQLWNQNFPWWGNLMLVIAVQCMILKRILSIRTERVNWYVVIVRGS